MAEGIILAGGYSSRAKNNKMLLPILGKPLILHTIASLSPYVKSLFVVTGHYDKEIKEALKDVKDIKVIYNPNYSKGMFTSIKRGVKEVNDDFFVLPGDCPFIRASTMNALMNAKGQVRVPTYKNETGHPIFFEKSLIKPLLSEDDINSNLKVFRDKCGYTSVEVNDENILNDIDTVEDYEKTINKLERN